MAVTSSMHNVCKYGEERGARSETANEILGPMKSFPTPTGRRFARDVGFMSIGRHTRSIRHTACGSS